MLKLDRFIRHFVSTTGRRLERDVYRSVSQDYQIREVFCLGKQVQIPIYETLTVI